jgi:hypothetical protein
MENMEKQQPKTLTTKQDFDDFLYKTPYFAFLDILGFKALVKKNKHETLVDLYEKLFAAQTEAVASNIEKLSQKRQERMGEQYTPAGLRMVNISDSILIWTQHGQPSALFEMVYAVSSLLGISLVQGLPLRGCITQQPFTVIEKNGVTSVVGVGLVHAYSMENIQQWAGCIIDEGIIKYFRSIEEKLYNRKGPALIERDHMVYPYDIPIKDPETKAPGILRGYAVNWCEPAITDDMIREAFDAHNKKDTRPTSDTPEKINNTIAFHQFCLQKKQEQQEQLKAIAQALQQGGQERQ